MKKSILLFVFATILLSCGTPKTVIQSKKVIKGYWELNTITYSESGNYNVILLNDASKECFEGSTWRFIPNNNSGNYTIASENCATGERKFIFTIQEVDQNTQYYDFLLKPTNEKLKSEDNKGFRIHLSQLSDSQMQWEQTVLVNEKPFTIYMNFSKINE